MRTKQTTIFAATAVLLFTLVGCEEPKVGLELKDPKPELKGDALHWTINGPVDASGNLIAPEEAK